MSRTELLIMMFSSKKNGPKSLSWVTKHYTFTSGLSRSCSERSLGGSLLKWHSYVDWHIQRCELLPLEWISHTTRNKSCCPLTITWDAPATCVSWTLWAFDYTANTNIVPSAFVPVSQVFEIPAFSLVRPVSLYTLMERSPELLPSSESTVLPFMYSIYSCVL